ncbi:hypothetical protein [uncultured Kordia sp.]|uniref:hypothetical protein n=1 Tax=uncultured Kordia sp. TaxID=507699 RepID=UPI002601C70A|nr:hypothetical protein [uncultured Kordia sp.]
MKTKKIKLDLRKVSIANLKLNSIKGGTVPVEMSAINTCQNSRGPECGPTYETCDDSCDGHCNNNSGFPLCTIGGDISDEGNHLCDTNKTNP